MRRADYQRDGLCPSGPSGAVGGEQLTAGDISEQQMVPKPFAYKIIKKLSKAGFVRINRGADGGCRLAVDWTR